MTTITTTKKSIFTIAIKCQIKLEHRNFKSLLVLLILSDVQCTHLLCSTFFSWCHHSVLCQNACQACANYSNWMIFDKWLSSSHHAEAVTVTVAVTDVVRRHWTPLFGIGWGIIKQRVLVLLQLKPKVYRIFSIILMSVHKDGTNFEIFMLWEETFS